MDAQSFGRLLIPLGAAAVILGVLLVVAGRVPPLGRLPGDLIFHRDGLTVYAPLVTMLLLSAALTPLLTVASRLSR